MYIVVTMVNLRIDRNACKWLSLEKYRRDRTIRLTLLTVSIRLESSLCVTSPLKGSGVWPPSMAAKCERRDWGSWITKPLSMSEMNFWMSGRAILVAMETFSSGVMPYSRGPNTDSRGRERSYIARY